MTRGEMMSRVKSRDTAPELRVRSFLHARGFRFSTRSKLPGRPDLWLPRWNAAVFVHGDFWYRPWDARKSRPKTNVAFWKAKIEANVARDRRAARRLRAMGIRVFTIWESAIGDASLERLEARIRRIP